MGITLLIVILLLWIIYNIIFYIPSKLKNYEEKMSIHFREVNLRMNRIEKLLEDRDKNE